jgi:acetoacetate decarboxylase
MFAKIRNAIKQWQELGVGERFFWHDARMVFIDIPIDANQVRDWLPWPLSLAKPEATLFLAHYPNMTFAPPYQESALLLKVKCFGMLPAVHYCWIVLNNDRGLIIGREMLGLPKKMADVRFHEEDGRVRASVHRNGVELIHFEGQIGAPVAEPSPGLGQRTINLRGLLNVLLPAHLLMFHPEETVSACRELTDIKFELRSSEDDPIGIASGAPLRATIRTCDIGPGKLPIRLFPVAAWFPSHLLRLRAR